jgi:hypothetical protein
MSLPEALYLESYVLYRANMQNIPDDNNYADFEWYQLAESEAHWFQYSQLLEFSRTISNTINALGNYSYRLRVWDITLNGLPDNHKMELLFEFAAPLADLALNLPFVIKSRLIFAITHLSHQANKVLDKENWRDNLPDDRDIKLIVARKYSSRWEAFQPLDTALERLCRGKILESRNKYVHRVPFQEIIGHTWFFERKVNKDGVTYDFGERPPIELAQLADELKVEFLLALQAHNEFKALVGAQLAAMRTISMT